MVLTEQSKFQSLGGWTRSAHLLVLVTIYVCLYPKVSIYSICSVFLLIHYNTKCICLSSDINVWSLFYLISEIAVACGHFSATLHLCVEPGEDPYKQAFSK